MGQQTKYYLQYNQHALCLFASNIKIAAETERFIESIFPSIGIIMFLVAESLHSWDNPISSEPTTNAVGWL